LKKQQRPFRITLIVFCKFLIEYRRMKGVNPYRVESCLSHTVDPSFIGRSRDGVRNLTGEISGRRGTKVHPLEYHWLVIVIYVPCDVVSCHCKGHRVPARQNEVDDCIPYKGYVSKSHRVVVRGCYFGCNREPERRSGQGSFRRQHHRFQPASRRAGSVAGSLYEPAAV